jgi:hypothetical protein
MALARADTSPRGRTTRTRPRRPHSSSAPKGPTDYGGPPIPVSRRLGPRTLASVPLGPLTPRDRMVAEASKRKEKRTCALRRTAGPPARPQLRGNRADAPGPANTGPPVHASHTYSSAQEAAPGPVADRRGGAASASRGPLQVIGGYIDCLAQRPGSLPAPGRPIDACISPGSPQRAESAPGRGRPGQRGGDR